MKKNLYFIGNEFGKKDLLSVLNRRLKVDINLILIKSFDNI